MPLAHESVGGPVVHFEINGKDARKLADYYSRLFGWRSDAGCRGVGVDTDRHANAHPTAAPTATATPTPTK